MSKAMPPVISAISAILVDDPAATVKKFINELKKQIKPHLPKGVKTLNSDYDTIQFDTGNGYDFSTSDLSAALAKLGWTQSKYSSDVYNSMQSDDKYVLSFKGSDTWLLAIGY